MQEEELIEALLGEVRAAGATTGGPHVSLGPGDDAALLSAPPGMELAWTVDDQVEEVHFQRAWGLEAAGRKAAGASLSDLAAMGARPLGALLSLTVPAGTGLGEVRELARGLGLGLGACGCPLLGGNVTRGPRLALSLSALGAVPRGRAWTRGGARAGDTLWVTGRVGLARVGLLWLLRGGDPGEALLAPAVARLLAPRPRFDLVPGLLAAGPSAALDLSDGLARDLPRLLLASRLAARVDTARLPGPPEAVAARLGLRAAELAWVGGEDYELLLAGPADLGARCAGADLTAIGELTAGTPGGLSLSGPLQGERFPGFDHLAAV